MENYLRLLLKGFEEDPADSEFQYGYKAAIEEALEWLELEQIARQQQLTLDNVQP